MMGEVLPFKRQSPAEKHKGRTLCRHNFHKWKIKTENKFDVREGRLVTVYECSRCGKTKIKAH